MQKLLVAPNRAVVWLASSTKTVFIELQCFLSRKTCAPSRNLIALLVAALLVLAGCNPKEDEEEDQPPSDTIVLTKEARKSIGIDVRTLQRTNYAKSIRIPGQVVEIPGITRHEVTTKTSGEISKIHAFEGDEVRPGTTLFEIELTHQEAIQHQLDLLDALAKLEVINAEIARLEKLLKTSEGAIPKTRLLKEQYERNHLRHTVSSRRQILRLLGLDADEIQQMIDEHKNHQQHVDDEDGMSHDPTLITIVKVKAPLVDEDESAEPLTYVMQDLAIHPGQHVDVGDLLCNLVDLRRLQIEGDAFQRDLSTVRDARRNDWSVTAKFPQRDGKSFEQRDLKIGYISSRVDHQSRSAKFVVPLPNPRKDKAPRKFLPGQRVELEVPVNEFTDAIVVPVEAVAQDGLVTYIFQVSGKDFDRREVHVLFRDDDKVVLDETAQFYVDKKIAMSGAYQLQLSLQNRTRPNDNVHSHGGGAPHSH